MPSRLRTCQNTADRPIPVKTVKGIDTSRPRTAYRGQDLTLSDQSNKSLTRMYAIASTAKAKLSTELDRPDHRLAILVGHANLLDALMRDLVNAEHERLVTQKDQKAHGSVSHVRWIDQVPEDDGCEEEQDSDASDGDADVVELVLQRSR